MPNDRNNQRLSAARSDLAQYETQRAVAAERVQHFVDRFVQCTKSAASTRCERVRQARNDRDTWQSELQWLDRQVADSRVTVARLEAEIAASRLPDLSASIILEFAVNLT